MSGQSLRKVWGAPALLGAITLFGLLSALLGTGWWSALSWIAMIVPLGIIIMKLYCAQHFKKDRSA